MEPTLAYFLGKLMLFTLLPFITILYIERWTIKTTFLGVCVKKEKLMLSILLGLGALIITVLIWLLSTKWGQAEPPSAYWNTIMFFDAFNEEFLCRGVLLLYLWKITDLKIAFITSIHDAVRGIILIPLSGRPRAGLRALPELEFPPDFKAAEARRIISRIRSIRRRNHASRLFEELLKDLGKR